jgi:hypothetical protein
MICNLIKNAKQIVVHFWHWCICGSVTLQHNAFLRLQSQCSALRNGKQVSHTFGNARMLQRSNAQRSKARMIRTSIRFTHHRRSNSFLFPRSRELPTFFLPMSSAFSSIPCAVAKNANRCNLMHGSSQRTSN